MLGLISYYLLVLNPLRGERRWNSFLGKVDLSVKVRKRKRVEFVGGSERVVPRLDVTSDLLQERSRQTSDSQKRLKGDWQDVHYCWRRLNCVGCFRSL